MEEAVIGACLVDAAYAIPVVKEHILDPSDFHDPHHRWIWEAIVALESRQRHVDWLTVSQQLKATLEVEQEVDGTKSRRSRLDLIGGMAAIDVFTTTFDNAVHVGSYAQVVADRAADRRIRECGLELTRLAYNESLSAAQKASIVARTTERALISTSRKGPITLTQAFSNLGDFLSEQHDRRLAAEERGETFDPNLLGLPTGFRKLDRITGGVVPGQPWVLGARPSMGKTSLGLALARSFVRFGDVYFSIADGSAIALARREVALWQGISIRDVTTGHARGAAEELEYGNHIFIDDDSDILAEEVASRVSMMKMKNPNLVAWLGDYLSLYAKSPKWEDVAEASRTFTRMCRRLNIASVALQQLKQSVDQREPNKRRPLKSDLAESNQVERDAKVIIAPYRPWLNEPEKYGPEEAEIHVLKNSEGPLGMVEAHWDKRTAAYSDLPIKTANRQGTLDEVRPEDVPG